MKLNVNLLHISNSAVGTRGFMVRRHDGHGTPGPHTLLRGPGQGRQRVLCVKERQHIAPSASGGGSLNRGESKGPGHPSHPLTVAMHFLHDHRPQSHDPP